MSNTARNSLVLILLLIIYGAFSTFALRKHDKAIAFKQGQIKHRTEEIQQFTRLASSLETLEEEYLNQQAIAGSQFKMILNSDSSTITYDYLLRILNWLNKDIPYNFGMSKNEETGFNEYIISGVAGYMDIVNFTRLVEYQKALVTIEDISLSSENTPVDSVNFSMVFRTHYKPEGTDPSQIQYNPITKSVSEYSLFQPRYTTEAPRYYDPDRSLIDLETCQLVALSEDKAFIRSSNGIIHMLKRGDRVLWGYLFKIDIRERLAVFKINKFGFEENQILYLNKQN